MRIHTLLALLAFVPTFVVLPAAADSTVKLIPAAAAPLESISPQACTAHAKGPHLAQLNCCKDHKGLCGCRAGKIVCCDGTISTEPGCTCHGDEGVAE
ncbi:MAG: hypothetical protein ACYCY9_07945 [Thiobacillus sp.]